MNGNEPATKQDIAELKSATTQEIADLKLATTREIADLRSATTQDIADLKSVTRQDIAELRVEMKSDREQLRAEASHQYNDLLETIRDAETKLLQAFYGYAASNDKRVMQEDANIAVFLSRMSTFETRLLEVEKRLNMPPAA